MTRQTQREAVLHARNTFTLAYVHADDVPRFVADGWHEVGVDPRYGSRIMRRDADDVADSYAPTRRLVEGRG